jgi:hypothetical protein
MLLLLSQYRQISITVLYWLKFLAKASKHACIVRAHQTKYHPRTGSTRKLILPGHSTVNPPRFLEKGICLPVSEPPSASADVFAPPPPCLNSEYVNPLIHRFLSQQN